MNLDHLQAFADVVELGSFSAAAERRKLTQPAVSQQVRQLERKLGVRLIERVGKRATPTPAGTALLSHVQQIDAAVSAARDSVLRHAAGTAGRVRLGTGATACIYLLPALLRDLRQRHPGLEVVVSTGNTVDVMRQVEENAIDLGFVTLPAGGRAFAVTPVLEDEFVAIAPRGTKLSASPGPAEMAQHPLVLYEPGAHTRRVVDDWFREAGLTLAPAMQLGSVEAIKKLVAAGLGLGILPGFAVRQPRDREGLLVRPLAPRLYRTLAIALRRDKPLTRSLRAVVDALAALGTT